MELADTWRDNECSDFVKREVLPLLQGNPIPVCIARERLINWFADGPRSLRAACDSIAGRYLRQHKAPLAARVARVIRIDEVWKAVDPLDMRAGFDTALARAVTMFARCASAPRLWGYSWSTEEELREPLRLRKLRRSYSATSETTRSHPLVTFDDRAVFNLRIDQTHFGGLRALRSASLCGCP